MIAPVLVFVPSTRAGPQRVQSRGLDIDHRERPASRTRRALRGVDGEEEPVISDPKSTEDAAKASLPGKDPEVNSTSGDKPAPPSIDEGSPATKDDSSGTSETD